MECGTFYFNISLIHLERFFHILVNKATKNDAFGYFNFVFFFIRNIYVSAVMIFYSPSHKNKLNAQHYENNTDETVEFVNLQTKLTRQDCVATSTTTESVLTTFANKISAS
jgi:hypothetical protein